MERDEAAASGLETHSLEAYHLQEIFKQTDGDMRRALAELLKRIFGELGITSGRVAIYGKSEVGAALAVFFILGEIMPDLELVGELDDSLLMAARATKDADEIERIRRMGEITTGVVGQVADYLSSHAARNNVLVKPNGEPLTIGEVKAKINLWLAERGAENPEGTIFALGHDAGVPHSTGKRNEALRLGETIIFDLFPCEAGGGYFYDFTRTWCLGYAPEAVQALYENVRSIHGQVMSELVLGAPFKKYQKRACELFEALGHPTVMNNPLTQEGYVHGLGHGVGLQVHERPFSRVTSDDGNRLDPGVVFTIEPGLYYPERGMGVRLEDTVWMRPDGVAEVLAEYSYELVLPVKTAR
jgi:Xaa-Pro aminopeptidase